VLSRTGSTTVGSDRFWSGVVAPDLGDSDATPGALTSGGSLPYAFLTALEAQLPLEGAACTATQMRSAPTAIATGS
jgi:hypothetical protein